MRINVLRTNNQDLLKDPQYHKIINLIDHIIQDDIIASSFSGNCVGSCDIIQTMLSQVGIKSKIVECQATVNGLNANGEKFFSFIGYDNYNYPGQIDTHCVLITENDFPILIDLSLGNVLPREQQFIVERVSGMKIDDNGREILSLVKLNNIEITYYVKKRLRLVNIHQKNIIQRILKEQEFETTIKFVKAILYCTLGLGLTNFFLNMILITIKTLEHI